MPRWRAEEGRGAGGGDDEEKSPPLRTHVSGLLTCGAEATWGRAVREGEVESAPVCGGVEASLAGSPPSRDVIRREASRPHVVASPPPPRLLLSCGSRPLFLSFLEAPVPLMGLGGAHRAAWRWRSGGAASDGKTERICSSRSSCPGGDGIFRGLSASLACLDACKRTCTVLSSVTALSLSRSRSPSPERQGGQRWTVQGEQQPGPGCREGLVAHAGMQHLFAR